MSVSLINPANLKQKNPFQKELDEFFRSVPAEIPKFRVDELPQRKETSLQSGSFGEAYLSSDNSKVVKVIKLNSMTKTMLFSLHNEIINYYHISTLCPKFFCKFIGYCYHEEESMVMIVMEFCGIDFFEYYEKMMREYDQNYLRNKGSASVLEQLEIKLLLIKKNIFFKVLEALNCLHSNNYAHLDLKPENIVVLQKSSGVEVKFIDAGSLTKIAPGPKVYTFGTLEYMAPELNLVRHNPYLDNNDNLKKLDIYSFGKMCMDRLSNKEIVCIFGSINFMKEILHENPLDRPDVTKIMRFVNPGYFEPKDKENIPQKTNRKRKLPKKLKKSKTRSKTRSKTYLS